MTTDLTWDSGTERIDKFLAGRTGPPGGYDVSIDGVVVHYG